MSQSASISGSTAVGGGGFAALVARCMAALADAGEATWTAAQVAAFLNDAIRDYSVHFPRLRQAALSLSAGANRVELPADFTGLLAVERPPGQQPPRYLARRAFTWPDFWTCGGWYDVVAREDGHGRSELWFSDAAEAGETAVIQYYAAHALIDDLSAPAGEPSVPAPHQPLLLKYVLWQATLGLLAAEQAAPSGSSSLLMAQLSQNARRAESSYHTALRQALYAAEGRSTAVSWAGLGRIY